MRLLIISGPTGSGKTSLSKQISNKIENSYILSTDNYYKTGIISKFLSRFIKIYFDRKISFNYRLFIKDFKYIIKNEKINHEYSYDFKNKKINKYLHKKESINLLIIEGIFAGELFNDYKKRNYSFVELKINKKVCMERAIKRDMLERGKDNIKSKIDFLKSWDFYYARNNKNRRKYEINFLLSNRADIDSLLNKFSTLKF